MNPADSEKKPAPDISKKKGDTSAILILLAFLIFYTAFNLYYLKIDKQPPSADEAIHLINSLRYYHGFRAGHIRELFLDGFSITNYPPATYVITSIFYLFSNTELSMAVISQLPFWILLVFSVYLLGCDLWNRGTGMLAAFISLTLPLMAFMSHEYLLDLPCAASVALCIMALFRSQGFKNTLWTAAFFTGLGFAALVKWIGVIYIIGPVSLVFLIFLWENRGDKKILLLMIALIVSASAVGIGIIVPASARFPSTFSGPAGIIQGGDVIWRQAVYLKSMIPIVCALILSIGIFKNRSVRNFSAGFFLFLILIWSFYPLNAGLFPRFIGSSMQAGINEGDTNCIIEFVKLFSCQYFGLPFSLFLLAGLIWYFGFSKKSSEKNIFMAGFVISLILLILLPNKDNRYLLPLTVYAACFSAFWIFEIRVKWLKIALAVLGVALGLLSWLGWIGDLPFLENSPHARSFKYGSKQPDTRSWKAGEIMAMLADLEKEELTHDSVVIITEKLEDPRVHNMMNRGVMEWIFFSSTGRRLIPGREFGNVRFDVPESARGYLASSYSLELGAQCDRVLIIHVYSIPGKPDEGWIDEGLRDRDAQEVFCRKMEIEDGLEANIKVLQLR